MVASVMNPEVVNQLKAFTTEPHVKQRPAYGRHIVMRPRVASLCATGNNLTFLTDQTGNRRWLPFHISHIDNPWTAQIPYEGMYAQALTLINSGERYWLDDKQIKELNERNKAYMTPDPAKEMIVTYFTIPRTEFEQVRTYKGRFWKVADRPEKEIDSRLPGDEPEPLPF